MKTCVQSYIVTILAFFNSVLLTSGQKKLNDPKKAKKDKKEKKGRNGEKTDKPESTRETADSELDGEVWDENEEQWPVGEEMWDQCDDGDEEQW